MDFSPDGLLPERGGLLYSRPERYKEFKKAVIMSEAEYQHGAMDISQQGNTWSGFVSLVKWGSIACIIFTVVAIIAIQ